MQINAMSNNLPSNAIEHGRPSRSKATPFHDLKDATQDNDLAALIFPPTPLGLFTTILPLTPPDVDESPTYVKELWNDFDRIQSVPTSDSDQNAESLQGKSHFEEPYDNSRVINQRMTFTDIEPVLQEDSSGRQSDLKNKNRTAYYWKKRCRRSRGSYRCRKCGGAKRAHDCPFACRQKSIATQTALEITGVNLPHTSAFH